MDNGITLDELNRYLNVVIPNIENKLSSNLPADEKLKLYNLYVEVLRMVARTILLHLINIWNWTTTTPSRQGLFITTEKTFKRDFQALNDMEIHDKYDILLISTPPRIGKTTAGIRFLAWICGRHPENTELAVSYSDNITNSFYLGVMEIVLSQRFQEVFPESDW